MWWCGAGVTSSHFIPFLFWFFSFFFAFLLSLSASYENISEQTKIMIANHVLHFFFFEVMHTESTKRYVNDHVTIEIK